MSDPSGHFGDPPSGPSKARQVVGLVGQLFGQQWDPTPDQTPPNTVEIRENPAPNYEDPPTQKPEWHKTPPQKIEGEPPPPRRLDTRYDFQVDVTSPKPTGTVPNQAPKHDITEPHGKGAFHSVKAGPPVERLPHPTKNPTPPRKTTTRASRPKGVKRMRGGGLLDRITGPVVAGVGGVFTYLESGDAEAAVKETIKASVEAISPLPVPEEKIVMELEQVELRLVYYGSLPTEVDQQAQRKAEAEQAQKKLEELSRPGLMKRDRPRPPDGTSLRGRLDHEIIQRIINQHKKR